MINAIKRLFSPKVESKILIKGTLPPGNVYSIQSTVQRWGFPGRIQLLSATLIQIELEGRMVAIEKRLEELRHSPLLGSNCTLQVSFFAASGKFTFFRIG
jgi:hypothetical protein